MKIFPDKYLIHIGNIANMKKKTNIMLTLM